MTIKELRQYLASFEQEAEVLVSSDEELNTMFSKFEVAVLGEDDNNKVVIYGLSGSEVEEDY
jgi:predicted glycosyltransferase